MNAVHFVNIDDLNLGRLLRKRIDKIDKTIKNSPGCLGFAPRSNSFVFEPLVQANSIFSLSGLTVRVVRPQIRWTLHQSWFSS